MNNKITPNRTYHPAPIFLWYLAHERTIVDKSDLNLIYYIAQSMFKNFGFVYVWRLISLCRISGANCEYLMTEVQANVKE